MLYAFGNLDPPRILKLFNQKQQKFGIGGYDDLLDSLLSTYFNAITQFLMKYNIGSYHNVYLNSVTQTTYHRFIDVDTSVETS